MRVHWWEEIFAEERDIYHAIHKAQPLPRGTRPAVIVVDVVRAFVGEPGQTLAESMRVWPTSCGPYAWEALPWIRRLLEAARGAAVPVVFTTAMPGGDRWFGGTVKGETGAMGSPMARPGAQEIPADIAPREGELVLAKPKASAFFGTALLAHLHRHRVDGLIVCGTTTSGCVRATVVEGFSWSFPIFVPEEAVFDRSRISHAVNLFEMNAKYADVITVADAEQWLAALRTASAEPSAARPAERVG